jgi:hypothetical protein
MEKCMCGEWACVCGWVSVLFYVLTVQFTSVKNIRSVKKTSKSLFVSYIKKILSKVFIILHHDFYCIITSSSVVLETRRERERVSLNFLMVLAWTVGIEPVLLRWFSVLTSSSQRYNRTDVTEFETIFEIVDVGTYSRVPLQSVAHGSS